MNKHGQSHTIELQTSRGVKLDGIVSTPKNESKGTVLFLRGGYGSLFSLDISTLYKPSSLFYKFAAANYKVYSIDYSGTGNSAGEESCNGPDQIRDIIDITAHLHEEELHPLILAGHSRGADAALLALNNGASVDAVIALSGLYDLSKLATQRPDLHTYLNTYISLSQHELRKRSILHQKIKHLVQKPLLLVHGEQDTRSPIENAISLHQKITKHLGKHMSAHQTYRYESYTHGGHIINKDWVEKTETLLSVIK